MSRNYQGYTQANQSLLEEDNEAHSEEDIEAGRTQKRGVSWDAGASEMNVLRPNIQQEDQLHENDSSEDDAPPQSFMVETAARRKSKGKGKQSQPVAPVQATRQSISEPPRPFELHDDEYSTPPHKSRDLPGPSRPHNRTVGLDPYERALWNWVNVYNLDAFLQDVYFYYEGKGIYSISLSRGLNLLYVMIFSGHRHSTHLIILAPLDS